MFSIAMLPQAGCEQSDIEHCSRLLVVRSLIFGSVGSDRFATRISAHGWSHVRARSGVIRVAQDSRCYNLVKVVAAVGGKQTFIGEWLSLVEHLVRDQGVGGSNPLSPTIF